MDVRKMMGADVEVPQIELVPIDHLIPYDANSKAHPDWQVEQIANSMEEFGWTMPILRDEHGIVAGHGRAMAARLVYSRGKQINFLGQANIPIGYAPVLSCQGWSEKQRRAYIIADNKLTMNGGWDEELLSHELRWLRDADYDLDLTGFGEDELDELLAEEVELPTNVDPDAVPDAPDEPVSVPGDVWVCGPHRVVCGDASDIDVWDRLMEGERADACFVDPPYNVDLGRKNRLMDKAVGGKRNANGDIQGDKMGADEFRELLSSIFGCLAAVLKPGSATYVAHADRVGDVMRDEFLSAGFHFSQMLVWNKGQHVLGMADYQSSHESIIYGWKAGGRHRWHGGRKQRTVIEMGDNSPFQQLEDGRWAIRVGDSVMVVDGDATIEEAPGSVIFEPKPSASGLHPSTKPVALIERLIGNNVRQGDIVIDGCGGSGSTLIAVDRLGACARLVELTPKYTDVCVRRWQEYTGRRAVHARTGEEFPEAPEHREAPPTEPPTDGDEDIF